MNERIKVGDRVKYTLSPNYQWFWEKEGTVVQVMRRENLYKVVLDTPVNFPGSPWNGAKIIDFGPKCLTVINYPKHLAWEI